MNIEQLQYICMVAKTNSITVAAENLYVTQQTISKAINKLEVELGVVLMIRSHKGVQLTDAGKEFVRRAGNIVREFQDLYESTYVSQFSGLSGELTLYQSTYTTHIIGQKFLTSMRRQYPKLKVAVNEMLTVDMINMVETSGDKIAFIQMINHNCGLGKIEDHEQWLDYEELCRDTLVVCVAANGPLGKKESISLKEVAKYPIAWDNCPGVEEIFLHEYDLGLNVLINSSNIAVQKEAILEGEALSFATEMLTRNGHYDGYGIKFLPIKENLRLSTTMIKPKGYQLSRQQTVALEEIKKALQKL